MAGEYIAVTLVLILVWGELVISQGTGDCQFRYLQQPPTYLDCNPYGSTLQISCLAIGPLNSSLQVVWFSAHANRSSALHRANLAHYKVYENDPQNNERFISSMLKIDSVGEKEKNLCFWCQMEVTRSLLHIPSKRLCIKEPEMYSNFSNCSSPHLVFNSTTLCVRVLRNTASIGNLRSEQFSNTAHTAAGPPQRTSPLKMSAFSAQLSSNSITKYLEIATTASRGGTHTRALPGISVVKPHPLDTGSLLLPSPTMERTSNHSGLLPGNSNLRGLYAAVVLCVLLAAVIVMLVVTILVLCKRRGWKHTILHSPKYFQNMSRFSSSGSEQVGGGGGGGAGSSYPRAMDIRYGSEVAALRGSLDTRSSGSREASSEHTNSLTAKNTGHKYSVIDTIPTTGFKVSHTRHTSLSDRLHLKSGSYNCLAPEVIPPPPNTRGRSNSTPHFYYILEKPEKEKESKYGTGDKRKGQRGEGTKHGSFKRECGSREGSLKKDSGWKEGSLKSEVWLKDGSLSVGRSRDGSLKVRSRDGSMKKDIGSREGSLKKEVGWREESFRSREGSLKKELRSREGSLKKEIRSKEGSLKKELRSREGSLKKDVGWRDESFKGMKSREGSLKEAVRSREGSLKRDMRSVQEGLRSERVSREGGQRKVVRSREGSFQKETASRGGSFRTDGGAREGSFKKGKSPFELSWPADHALGSEGVGPIPNDYDSLAPRELECVTPTEECSCHYFRENIFEEVEDMKREVIFDDPKYAAVDIVELPRLVNRHPSLDPILPQRMRAVALGRGKATSSKSLQDAGLNNKMRESPIYLSRDITPTRDIILATGRGPSRMSVPADTYYS